MALKKVAGLFEGVMVVEGTGDFPFDMLRYDNAMPLREIDSGLMYRAEGTRRVALRWFAWNKGAEPTKGRWASFGWKIIAVGPDTHSIFSSLPKVG